MTIAGFELVWHAAHGERVGAFGPHLMLDALLMLPLAFIAISVGRRICRNNSPFARAFTTSLLLLIMLIPSVGAHSAIHRAIGGGFVIAGHAHGAVGAREGFVQELKHGVRDGGAALPVAFAVLWMMNSIGRLRVPQRRAGLAAFLSIALATPLSGQAASPVVTPFAVPLPIPAVLTSADVSLTAQSASLPILPGATTDMWTFNGTFPGPVIRRPSGAQTRVTVTNQLPASAGDITLHNHGNHSASSEDGQPHDNLIPSGASRTYTYDFTEAGGPERGAIQWYHDHRMDVTGRNVWMGLAGMVILDDPSDAAVDAALPSGPKDVPLMVVDRTFDGNNQIPYNFLSDGVIGKTLLVNGAPQPYFEVADTRYRLRLLNASNARSYDFALDDGRPLIQVGSESGLLPSPVTRTHILLGPAERADVIVDFGSELGRDIVLRNLDGYGSASQVMQFRVRRDEPDASSIPSALRAAPTFDDGALTANRTWVLGRDLGSGMWTINGRGFDHGRVDASPKLGTTERWTFINPTSVDHIMHIHDVDWRIVLRSGGLPPSPGLAADESGLKESFRLRAGETVTLVSRFTDHLGKYVLHCHILEHEDYSMMSQFQVVP